MEFPEVDKLVSERRQGVLLRAIEVLETASIEQLRAVSHKIAGSLSLYLYIEEGSQARAFSIWLESNPVKNPAEIMKRRDEILDGLKKAEQ